MFTGIIESLAKVKNIEKVNTNFNITFETNLAKDLKIDQSVAHNGICLTVVDIKENTYTVTAIDETMKKTNLENLKINDLVNLERSMLSNGRFDGHIVQGHVDTIGTVSDIKNENGSYIITITYSKSDLITVEKGSITINGISLTVFNSQENSFSVAIIPYTWNHTNLQNLKIGDSVNLEFDILGKYIQKYIQKTQ